MRTRTSGTGAAATGTVSPTRLQCASDRCPLSRVRTLAQSHEAGDLGTAGIEPLTVRTGDGIIRLVHAAKLVEGSVTVQTMVFIDGHEYLASPS